MNDALSELLDRLSGRPLVADAAYWRTLQAEAQDLRIAAREANESANADVAWYLLMVAQARATMCELFTMMREGEFRKAWPLFEHLEKMIESLLSNEILEDTFYIAELGHAVARWQDLYPYTVFASPEMIIKEVRCTLCDQVISPFRQCGHLPGRVYAGEMCSRTITQCEFVSIALVRDPVQKYSVLIPETDPHDYARLRFTVERLSGPFSRWRKQTVMAFHDHKIFAGWDRDGFCPCHSGFRYRDCCGPQSGVRLPHDQILMEDELPPGLPRFIVRRRASSEGEMEDLNGTAPIAFAEPN